MDEIKEEILKDLKKVKNLNELKALRDKFLGKEGKITKLLSKIREIPREERKEYGKRVNLLKEFALKEIERKRKELEGLILEENLKGEWEDLSFYQGEEGGNLHPITKTLNRILQIFLFMNFTLEEGPEVEREDYNFDLLNIPKEHPARDMQDTFYLNREGYLLRTHTSPVQIRTMLKKRPPIRMVSAGKVYRRDDDPTHSPMFFQVEGLVVDRDTNIRQLKYTVRVFLKLFFGQEVKVRFRSSYFPFTEPSLEVDIGCLLCKGKGCGVCKGTGYLEVMGCGMVHSRVLKNCGIDPQEYRGFAFGLGVERLCMLYYQIPNIKLFYENDLRFLKQF